MLEQFWECFENYVLSLFKIQQKNATPILLKRGSKTANITCPDIELTN